MIWNTSVPFYSNLISDRREDRRGTGVDLDIQSGNGDLATQISDRPAVHRPAVDMILIAPSDPEGIVPVVLQANAGRHSGDGRQHHGRHQHGRQSRHLRRRRRLRLRPEAGRAAGPGRRRQGQGRLHPRQARHVRAARPRGGLDGHVEEVTRASRSSTARRPTGTMPRRSRSPRTSSAVSRQARSTRSSTRVRKASTARSSLTADGRTDVKFIMGDYPADVRNADPRGHRLRHRQPGSGTAGQSRDRGCDAWSSPAEGRSRRRTTISTCRSSPRRMSRTSRRPGAAETMDALPHASVDAADPQELRRRAGSARRRLRRCARRDPRARRPQRGRQEHADEGARRQLRRLWRKRRGRGPGADAATALPRRSRAGVAIIYQDFALAPNLVGRGQHRARPRARRPAARHHRPSRRCVDAPPRRRSGSASTCPWTGGSAARRRRAAADRDRPGLLAPGARSW